MKIATVLFLVSLLITSSLIMMYHWKYHQEALSRRAAEFRAYVSQYALKDRAYDLLHSRSHFLAEAADIPEHIFHPAPAIAGRVQSTQYEHLVTEGPLIDIDYLSLIPWPLVPPMSLTRGAFISATSQQIDSMNRFLRSRLKVVLDKSGLAAEYESIFTEQHRKNIRIMANWPAANEDLKSLTSYQTRLSDQIFELVQHLLANANISVHSSQTRHGISLETAPIGQRHANDQSAPIEFDHSNSYKLDGHQLLKVASPMMDFVANQKLINIAQQHVQSIYGTLIDRYQHLIDEMDAVTFAAEVPTVRSVGNEMVFDYIRADHPTLAQLDSFSTKVNDAMTESLFEILLNHGVDIDQYGDASTAHLGSSTVDTGATVQTLSN